MDSEIVETNDEVKDTQENGNSQLEKSLPFDPLILEEPCEKKSINYYSDVKPQGWTPYETVLQKKILDVFEILDESKEGIITYREFSIAIRSFNCFPTEKEIKELLTVVEEIKAGCYSVSDVLPILTKVLVEDRFRPPSTDALCKAFEFLEAENNGFLDAMTVTDSLSKYGEPMSEETVKMFIDVAMDSETGLVNYQKYINQPVCTEKLKVENEEKEIKEEQDEEQED